MALLLWGFLSTTKSGSWILLPWLKIVYIFITGEKGNSLSIRNIPNWCFYSDASASTGQGAEQVCRSKHGGQNTGKCFWTHVAGSCEKLEITWQNSKHQVCSFSSPAKKRKIPVSILILWFNKWEWKCLPLYVRKSKNSWFAEVPCLSLPFMGNMIK